MATAVGQRAAKHNTRLVPRTILSRDGAWARGPGTRLCAGRCSLGRLSDNSAKAFADQGFFKNKELLLGPLEAGAQGPDLRVAGQFLAVHFSHELDLLPVVEQLGADTQLLSRGLCAAALACQS